MNNISLNTEDIFLQKNESYFIIDGLYLSLIKEKFFEINKSDLEKELRDKVFNFSRTDTPFTIFQTFKSDKNKVPFMISNIIKADENDKKEKCFVVDSGLLVFIGKSIFSEFVNDFDYDKLVDSDTSPINLKFWDSLYVKYDNNKIALILAPGIDSGYDFEGSGLYKIQI